MCTAFIVTDKYIRIGIGTHDARTHASQCAASHDRRTARTLCSHAITHLYRTGSTHGARIVHAARTHGARTGIYRISSQRTAHASHNGHIARTYRARIL
jgi:hypothetical protein